MSPLYRFFVQPQIDVRTKAVTGYELLLKEFTAAGWRMPASFKALDSQLVADLLVKTTRVLGQKVEYCAINVSREQLVDTTIAAAIVQSQLQLYPAKLVVEITEETGPRSYPDTTLIPHLRNFVEHGMQVSIDDVGSGINDFKSIQEFLPLVSELKFALQNFRSDIHDTRMQERLHFWHAICAEYGLRMVLEGVENAEDEALSERFNINFRQGYYYSKPRLLRLPGDPVTFTADFAG